MNDERAGAGGRRLRAGLGLLFGLSLGWLTYGNYRAGSPVGQLLGSALLLSVPLGLFYASLGLLAAGWQQRRRGPLDRRLAARLYWTPRVAGVLIALFVGLFALDVFGEGPFGWPMLTGFLIHLLPALALVAGVALAWRWEWVGCLAFTAAGLFFLRFVLANRGQEVGMFLLFSGPMLAIALLFGANWRWKGELGRPAGQGAPWPHEPGDGA